MIENDLALTLLERDICVGEMGSFGLLLIESPS